MRYLEDFKVGDVYELGSYHVTAEEIIEFGQKFDPQPYHVDEDLGRNSLFGGLIASGWHTAAMFMRLYVDTLLMDAAVEGSPGVDELRWLRPVRPGDVLNGRLAIAVVAPSLTRPNCGTLQKHCEFTDGQGRPVMKMVLYSMVRRRPTGERAERTS